jgi:hypothetical protein
MTLLAIHRNVSSIIQSYKLSAEITYKYFNIFEHFKINYINENT